MIDSVLLSLHFIYEILVQGQHITAYITLILLIVNANFF